MSIQTGAIGNGMKQLNDDAVDLNKHKKAARQRVIATIIIIIQQRQEKENLLWIDL